MTGKQRQNDDNNALSRLGRDFDWLAEMILPVWEKREAERAALEAARRAVEERTQKVVKLDAQLEALMQLAAMENFTQEEVEAYCKNELFQRALQAARDAEAHGIRRIGNAELMVAIGRKIREANRPLNIDEIMSELERDGIYLPGKDPRKNVLAYLSRSPLIKSTRKGWYFIEPDLLATAEQKLKGSGKLFEEGEEA